MSLNTTAKVAVLGLSAWVGEAVSPLAQHSFGQETNKSCVKEPSRFERRSKFGRHLDHVSSYLEKLREPISSEVSKEVQQLVSQCGHDSYRKRKAAETELCALAESHPRIGFQLRQIARDFLKVMEHTTGPRQTVEVRMQCHSISSGILSQTAHRVPKDFVCNTYISQVQTFQGEKSPFVRFDSLLSELEELNVHSEDPVINKTIDALLSVTHEISSEHLRNMDQLVRFERFLEAPLIEEKKTRAAPFLGQIRRSPRYELLSYAATLLAKGESAIVAQFTHLLDDVTHYHLELSDDKRFSPAAKIINDLHRVSSIMRRCAHGESRYTGRVSFGGMKQLISEKEAIKDFEEAMNFFPLVSEDDYNKFWKAAYPQVDSQGNRVPLSFRIP